MMAFAADKGYCIGVPALRKIQIGLVRPEIYLIFSSNEIILLKSRDRDLGCPPCICQRLTIFNAND